MNVFFVFRYGNNTGSSNQFSAYAPKMQSSLNVSSAVNNKDPSDATSSSNASTTPTGSNLTSGSGMFPYYI